MSLPGGASSFVTAFKFDSTLGAILIGGLLAMTSVFFVFFMTQHSSVVVVCGVLHVCRRTPFSRRLQGTC
jgi:hypothetical protein